MGGSGEDMLDLDEEEKKEDLGAKYENVMDQYSYGYCNKYKDVFKGKEDLLKEVADFDPLEVEREKRLETKFEMENDKFDHERYAFDNFDDEHIEEVNLII